MYASQNVVTTYWNTVNISMSDYGKRIEKQ